MNDIQIKRFIRKAAGKDIPFSHYILKTNNSSKYDNYVAFITTRKEIQINRDVFSQFGEIVQRTILIHEIGHIKDKNTKGAIKREYFAFRWAINRAYKLGMKRIAREQKKWIRRYYQDTGGYWNKKGFRRYVLAAKLAKENGLI